MTSTTQIELHKGELRFTAFSRGEGALVLFLHGFPDLPATWEPQLEACAAAGYRAVAVTLRGFERSSIPGDGSCHLSTLTGDVIAWLDDLKSEEAYLVGHDWGAPIALLTAAAHPARVRSVTAIAVPHPGRFLGQLRRSPRQLWLSRYMGFFQLRGFAEQRMRNADMAYIDRLWRRWSPGWEYDPALTERVRGRLSEAGVLEATLAYYRQALDTSSAEGRATAGLLRTPIPVPCMALHGAQDGCIDAEVFRSCMRAKDFPAGLAVHTLAEGGHFVHREAAGAVNDLLLDWLQANPAGGAP